ASARLEAQGALALPAGEPNERDWRWSGTVERFESSAPLAVSLAAAMPLAIDAGGVEAGPAALASDGGRLELSRLVYRDGRFEVDGQAQRLPVSRWAQRFGLVPEPTAAIDEVLLAGDWRLAGTSLDDLDGSASLSVTTGANVDGNGSAEL